MCLALAGVAGKGHAYLQYLDHGQGKTETAYLAAAWLAAFAVVFLLAATSLVRSAATRERVSSKRNSQSTVRTQPSRTQAEFADNVRRAFARRPLLAGLLSIVFIAIPIGLVAITTPGG